MSAGVPDEPSNTNLMRDTANIIDEDQEMLIEDSPVDYNVVEVIM